MTRLIFTHSGPSSSGTEYVNGLVKALEGRTDVVVTREDLTVQVDFVAPVDKLVIETLAYQIRVYDITACTGTTPPEGGGNIGGDDSGNSGGNRSEQITVTGNQVSGGGALRMKTQTDCHFVDPHLLFLPQNFRNGKFRIPGKYGNDVDHIHFSCFRHSRLLVLYG